MNRIVNDKAGFYPNVDQDNFTEKKTLIYYSEDDIANCELISGAFWSLFIKWKYFRFNY